MKESFKATRIIRNNVSHHHRHTNGRSGSFAPQKRLLFTVYIADSVKQWACSTLTVCTMQRQAQVQQVKHHLTPGYRIQE